MWGTIITTTTTTSSSHSQLDHRGPAAAFLLRRFADAGDMRV
jgi:hypothetical protein